jgi:hypothetical protein
MLAALLLSVSTLITGTTTASAQCVHQTTRCSTCSNCGGSVTWVLQTVGYDCHGCPVRRWVQLTHYCTPRRSCDHYQGHGHGYGYAEHYQRPTYRPRRCR